MTSTPEWPRSLIWQGHLIRCRAVPKLSEIESWFGGPKNLTELTIERIHPDDRRAVEGDERPGDLIEYVLGVRL